MIQNKRRHSDIIRDHNNYLDDSYDQDAKTCVYCGESGLKWHYFDDIGKWRLISSVTGDTHVCCNNSLFFSRSDSSNKKYFNISSNPHSIFDSVKRRASKRIRRKSFFG